MKILRKYILFTGAVGNFLFLSGAATNEGLIGEQDETCSGPVCPDDATQVPSLLQKAKSQMASTVLPEDNDDFSDEMAADLIMQELADIGSEHAEQVQKTLALNRQNLMLEEDKVRANAVIKDDVESETSAKPQVAVPFAIPFDTTGYTGVFGRVTEEVRGKRKKKTGRVFAGQVYYKIDKKFIHIGMVSNNGFVGVGLNGRNPSMRNADIIVCRDWKGDNTVSARDFHATGNKAPQPDGGEDWKIDESGKKGPLTYCLMHRARVTCETWEDYQAYNDDTNLFGLVAWSHPSAANDELAYHGADYRDVMPFNFMGAGALAVRTFPADWSEMTVKAPTCTVPEIAGSYICSYHVLPVDANKKYHITQWNAIWDDNSPAKAAKVQHHMDLNACSGKPKDAVNGQETGCAAAMAVCGEVLLSGVAQYSKEGAWMDDDAGIAIGKDATMEVLISIHFYNPTGLPGVTDSNTRFQIKYTEKLRQKNFMVFIITTSQIKVPAQTTESIHQNYCTHECTERLVGSTEIRFIGFHMHLAGKTAKLRLVRDGLELEPIAIVDPWDDAMSAMRVKRTIVPADNLLGECIYKNPTDRILPFGPELENEMCVITMSIVGPGTMKMCADQPWGQLKPPRNCWVKKNGKRTGKLHPWPICTVGIPMTFCPDAQNKKGIRGSKPLVDTAAGHSLKFVSWGNRKRRDCVSAGPGRELVPAEAGSCHLAQTNTDPSTIPAIVPAGGRSDTCSDDFTAHSVTKPNVIVGEQDLDGDLKVSWQTDCAAKEITFVVDAAQQNVGWLAVGLLDGGDEANPKGKPGNSMNNMDVVMLDPAKGKLKDAQASGYFPPKKKKTKSAVYVEGGQKCGNTWAKFKRPLTTADGLSLTEKGFIYLVAAYNTGGKGDMKQKHAKARAWALKISLFGGKAESYRAKDGAVKPEPEPEPESEAEKNVNAPIHTGECTEPATKIEQCWAWAGNAGVPFTESRALNKKKKFPKGCFFRPGTSKLFLNVHPQGGSCSAKWGCLCKSKHPEPEPEPEAEMPFKVEAGLCKRSYTSATCAAMAKKVIPSVTATSATEVASLNAPPGCFVQADGAVYFNTQSDSKTECHHTGVMACVCPVKGSDARVITKAPAPGPPATSGGPSPGNFKDTYKDTKMHCVASNVVGEQECKDRAAEYITKNNLNIKIKKFKTFASAKWPEGCWILPKKKKVFFNTNTASQIKCGNGGSWCMCKATFVLAKNDAECTHKITLPEECEEAAKAQKIQYKKFITKELKKKWPTGCFELKGRLFFNTRPSGGKCGKKKSACICEA